MLSKRARPYDPGGMPAPTRLRKNIQDIVGENVLPVNRARELLRDIAGSGVPGFHDLTGGTRSRKNRLHQNAARLRNKFGKFSKWPREYKARIRVLNKKTGAEERRWCSFFLPHEVLDALAKAGEAEALYETTNLDTKTKEHLDYCEGQANCRLIALGLWCDGVPCNWDRTRSVETVSLNLPGLSAQFRTLRIPLVSILRDHVSEHTFDDIFEVITWSLRQCARGATDPCRHDDREYHKRYGDQLRRPNQPLMVKSALCEVRGDWKMMGEVFKLPKHNENAGICWSCPCTLQEVRCFL